MFHNKYMTLKDNNMLLPTQKYIPLVLLNPDYDGMTALELAVELHRPKTFDLMINLLSQFDEFCISRMMLNVLPKMLQQETDIVAKFFNSCIFQAESMKSPMVIPWVEDTAEVIFACHTSIITDEIIKKHINYPKQIVKEKELIDLSKVNEA